jgi:hypothetical protein
VIKVFRSFITHFREKNVTLNQQLRNIKAGKNIDTVYLMLNRVSERNKLLPPHRYGTAMQCVHKRLQQGLGKRQ